MITREKVLDVFYQEVSQRYKDLTLGLYPRREATALNNDHDGWILIAKDADWHRTDSAYLGFKGFVIRDPKGKRIGVVIKGEVEGETWLTKLRQVVMAGWIPDLTLENWREQLKDSLVSYYVWRGKQAFRVGLITEANFLPGLQIVEVENFPYTINYINLPEQFVVKTEKIESGGYSYSGIPIVRAVAKTFEVPVEYKSELIDFLVRELETKLNLTQEKSK